MEEITLGIALFDIAFMSLLVGIATFVFSLRKRHKTIGYLLGAFFVVFSMILGLVAVFAFLGDIVKVIDIDGDPTVPSSISRFEVVASVPKNRTGYYVNEGDLIQIEYLDGQWTGLEENPGLTTGCGFYFDDPNPANHWDMPPEYRGSALIGYIGSIPFYIGCESQEFVASTSGELYLGMSDCRDCFYNNAGSLFVRVTVIPK